MKIKTLIIVLAVAAAIPLFGCQTVYAAPDFSGYYVKEHPNMACYYNELNGKTIVFNKYDPDAELYKGDKQPYNFYELAYWNPKECWVTSRSSNPKVARVYDQCELYGSTDSDGGYYTNIIEARKKGTTTITVRETIEEESYEYDEDGNEVEDEPEVNIYKFKVVVTDKWYLGRLHYYTRINHANVYRSSKKLKVTLRNVVKGDKITIKVGKSKKITKRIKKNQKKVSYTVKFKKQAAGRSVVVKIYDKYGKTVRESSEPIYYASKIKLGLTKKQVRLVPGWGSPQHTDVNGVFTTWWYDNYTRHVNFERGKVIGWGD